LRQDREGAYSYLNEDLARAIVCCIARDGDVADGCEAVALYHDMRAARGKRRKALAEQLLRYNENDLIALAAVATFFKTRQKPLADRSIEVEAKWYSLSHLWSSE
jgi:hypothetical protein